MYLLHLLVAISVLTVCTAINNPINLAPIARLDTINIHNDHRNRLPAIHTGIKKRSLSPKWLEYPDHTKRNRDLRQIDPELAKLYKYHKKGQGILATHTEQQKRGIIRMPGDKGSTIYQYDARDRDELYKMDPKNHTKDGLLVTNIENKKRDLRQLDPELAEMYKNHKKGQGLLATHTEQQKRLMIGMPGDKGSTIYQFDQRDRDKLHNMVPKNHTKGGLLATNTENKKRGSWKMDLGLAKRRYPHDSTTTKRPFLMANKNGDWFFIMHDEKKKPGEGLDPELAKLYKNHKKGLLAIWDGHIGDHIDPILGELYKHHKKGDGVLSIHDVNDGHGMRPGHLDPALATMYKKHKIHDGRGSGANRKKKRKGKAKKIIKKIKKYIKNKKKIKKRTPPEA